MANFKRLPSLKPCHCGSGLEREARYDARGIFLTYVCEKCVEEKLGKFRPEVLTDPNYDLMGEELDDDGDLADPDIHRDLPDFEDPDVLR
jgi:hypothetical protein